MFMDIMKALKGFGLMTRLYKTIRANPDKTDIILADVAAKLARKAGFTGFDPSKTPEENRAAFEQFTSEHNCKSKVSEGASALMGLVQEIQQKGASSFTPEVVMARVTQAIPEVQNFRDTIDGAKTMAQLFGSKFKAEFTDAEVIDDYQPGDIDRV